ncbi:MAG: hypothetical protein ACYS9X_05665 [Planctomycetota bacterium]|jgi:hypothetical protein
MTSSFGAWFLVTWLLVSGVAIVGVLCAVIPGTGFRLFWGVLGAALFAEALLLAKLGVLERCLYSTRAMSGVLGAGGAVSLLVAAIVLHASAAGGGFVFGANAATFALAGLLAAGVAMGVLSVVLYRRSKSDGGSGGA